MWGLVLLLFTRLYVRAGIITGCQVICEGWYYYCSSGYMWGLVLLLFARLYVRAGIITVCQAICEGWYYYCSPGYMRGLVLLLTSGRHLDDHIISLRRAVWALKTSLNLPPFIEMPMPSQESELTCICVLGVFGSTILELFFDIFCFLFCYLLVDMWYCIHVLLSKPNLKVPRWLIGSWCYPLNRSLPFQTWVLLLILTSSVSRDQTQEESSISRCAISVNTVPPQ